jgi:D-alanyl-D-alanine carboxypeptidase/D-alanyl-D-alanine-endopeptidase (penicillin-binding protein 4)
VLARWLADQGLDLPGLHVENGSGLSRSERVGAAGLARVLQRAAAGPHADLLRDSLPVVGVDGTMKRRLADEPVAGRAWIKTGSLADVRSIAGYVDAASGRRHAVVFIVNGPRATAAPAAQDRFLRWVHANG